MEDLRTKSAKGVVWSAIQHGATPVISLVVFIVLARLVDPSAFGLIALAGAAVSFLQLFLSSGFGSAIVQREQLEPQHLDSAFWANIGIATLLMVIIIFLADYIALMFEQPDLSSVILWLSLSLPLGALSQVQMAILRRNLAFRSLAVRSLIAEPIGGVIGVTMAFMGFGVWSLVARQLATTLFKVMILWKVSNWRPGYQVSRRHFMDLVGFGASMAGTNFVGFFSRRSDDILIGYFLGATALGYYSVAYRLFRMMTEMIGGTVNNVAWPVFSRLQNDLPRLRSALYMSTNIVCFLAWPLFLGMFALTPDLIPMLFGEKWLPSVPVMQVLAFIGLLHSIFFFNESVIVSVGKPHWRLMLQFVIAICNVIAFFVVVKWGIVAVAAAYVVVGYLFAPVFVWMIKLLIGISYAKYAQQYLAPAIASLIMIATVYGLKAFIDSDRLSAIHILLVIVVAIVCYLLSILVLSPNTIRDVMSLLKKARGKSSAPG
jgi:O-antigen/teichoic acid export membrane protein